MRYSYLRLVSFFTGMTATEAPGTPRTEPVSKADRNASTTCSGTPQALRLLPDQSTIVREIEPEMSRGPEFLVKPYSQSVKRAVVAVSVVVALGGAHWPIGGFPGVSQSVLAAPTVGYATFPLGRSEGGQRIVGVRAGYQHGTRVLVVGCIHGTECAGIAVAAPTPTDRLPAVAT
jgi:hypothetical protein